MTKKTLKAEVKKAAGAPSFAPPVPPGAPSTVEHPKHYNSHPTGIECIDIVETMGFNVGNAIKYLWRAGLKPGTETIEDLRKAEWYVRREIERLTGNISTMKFRWSGPAHAWFAETEKK